MKINRIKVANILSFGPTQEIDEFRIFNLFIGKNGSGKSNLLKILKGLQVNYHMLDGAKIQIQTQTHSGGIETKEINVFTPEIIMGNYKNRDAAFSNIKSLIEIEYEEITNVNQVSPEIKIIKYLDDADRTIRYIEGNVSSYEKNISDIKVPETEFEFYKDLALFLGSKAIANLPLLNFGLFYIFGHHYIFDDRGTFTQGKIYRGGAVEENTSELPSGVLNCSKILTRYFMAQGDVIIIDEPELHLEPRIIRKLFEFLVWLIIRWKEEKTLAEHRFFSMVEEVRLSNYSEGSDGKSYSIWSIPNGEHQVLDIQLEKQSYNRQKQVFIASHSSVLIDQFLSLDMSASVYELDSTVIEYDRIFPTPKTDDHFAEKITKESGLFSVVNKIDISAYSLLDNLGSKGSDLLQTNGVIWVEGPSDVIYIKKWLEMYACENNKPAFKQGRDYEFQMFGGTLLDSLCLIKEGDDEEQSYKKLVSMFSFSRNAFVVIDSDAVKNSDGEIFDKSKFFNAKSYIKKQFEALKKNREGLGLWYQEGNINIRTMESYLDDSSKRFIKKSWSKKIAAQKVTKSWSKDKKLSDFKSGLESQIKELYDTISIWGN